MKQRSLVTPSEAIAIAVAWAVLTAFWGGVAYVVWHFISKFW